MHVEWKRGNLIFLFYKWGICLDNSIDTKAIEKRRMWTKDFKIDFVEELIKELYAIYFLFQTTVRNLCESNKDFIGPYFFVRANQVDTTQGKELGKNTKCHECFIYVRVLSRKRLNDVNNSTTDSAVKLLTSDLGADLLRPTKWLWKLLTSKRKSTLRKYNR